MRHTVKILQLTTVDLTVKSFLLPLIDGLTNEGYQVHIACAEGKYTSELKDKGYIVHKIPIERRISIISNFKSLWRLYRLIREERFDVVHVHTAIASVLGRLAAWLNRVPIIVYTVHGFYFHENMPPWKRRLIIWMERCLCHITHLVLTVSQEDAIDSINEGICTREKVIWIGNGVNLGRFASNQNNIMTRKKLGLNPEDKVIGFVGRLVAEKGVLELIEAMRKLTKVVPNVKLLLVGDTLDSERDKKTKQIISDMLSNDGLAPHIILTGFLDDIAEVMSTIDVFVLPSHREGLPVTVIEAMASGKPVVATNIRGCREEVVSGSTGLLVPIRNPDTLAKAIITVLSNPKLARKMGKEGRLRANALYNERVVLKKQIKAYANIIRQRLPLKTSIESTFKRKRVQCFVKRVSDIIISLLCLTILSAPFLLIAVVIKIDSRGPVFFRQERVGKDGKNFRIWKLRTMIDNAVQHGLGLNVSIDDSRITRVGKILRILSLDELPQLINVFAGDMSLVGPRPTVSAQVENYNDFERQRLLVRPGITSLPLIRGRNMLSWKERINLDIEYLSGWSLWSDVKIVLGTFWVVLITRKGIYGPTGINDDFVSSKFYDSDNAHKRQI